MKNCILLTLLIMSLNLYSEKKSKGIQFSILNKDVKNSDSIKLLIKNTSVTNYYLPIINTPESEKLEFIVSSKDRVFFFNGLIFIDSISKVVLWHSDLTSTEDLELNLLSDSWENKKANITVNDLILLKHGDSVLLKIPINLKIVVSKKRIWKLEDYKKVEKVYILYHKKDFDMEKKCLNKNTIEKLKELGYKLYTDEIISNSVKFIPTTLDDADEARQNDIDSATIKFHERSKKHVNIPRSSIQWKYYCYHTPNLRILKYIDTTPYDQLNDELNSIQSCFSHLDLIEINKLLNNRLIEIARANFKNKIYLYLVSGTGSVEFAEKQNENIEDDNKFIYISVDDFINSKEILNAVEIYNRETKRLMGK